jgi:hypothetical protein
MLTKHTDQMTGALAIMASDVERSHWIVVASVFIDFFQVRRSP